jgi:hypothetical protein
MKERCKAKVTAKSKRKSKKQQQFGLLSLAEVCFSLVLAYLSSILVLAISFSLCTMAKAANLDRSQRLLCPGPCWW